MTSNLVIHSPEPRICFQRLRVPRARLPPQKGPGLSICLAASGANIFPDFAIHTAEKQQRIPFPYDNVLNLGDENRVIARILG